MKITKYKCMLKSIFYSSNLNACSGPSFNVMEIFNRPKSDFVILRRFEIRH